MGRKLGFFGVCVWETLGGNFSPPPSLPTQRQLLSSATRTEGVPSPPIQLYMESLEETPFSQYVSRKVKGKEKVNNAC